MFLILFAPLVASQAWNRRAYYNDLKCQGYFAYGIQVYYGNTPCPGGVSNPQANAFCETKSTNALAPSSEGSLIYK